MRVCVCERRGLMPAPVFVKRRYIVADSSSAGSLVEGDCGAGAAVDGHRVPRDVRRGVARQQQHRRGHLSATISLAS